jgi:hypothetical protein
MKGSEAAGGYSLPATFVFGSQVHHSDSGTPSSTDGICLPQPRHDLLAVFHKYQRESLSEPALIRRHMT